MARHFLAGGLMLLALAAVSNADDKAAKAKPAAHAQFEKIKKMAGTWVAADKDGKPTDKVVSVIKVTAGGSAVHETLFPGEAMEMLSVYHLDGADLVMTHYCVLGNQPRMKAEAKSPANKIVFDFAGGTNLDVKKDKHMHGATLTFEDDDHVEISGVAWENGKSVKCCEAMKIVRKK